MRVWGDLRQLPRTIWLLSGATLVNRVGTMVLPFLTLYLTQDLGFSASLAGLGLAAYGAAAIVVGPIAGRLIDRFGPMPVMRASLILGALVLAVLPFARSKEAVFSLIMLWSLVSEAYRPANLAIIADLVPPHQRKNAFALVRTAINLGMSIGPAVAGFLATVSFRSIFAINAITAMLAAVVLFGSRWPAHHVATAKESVRAPTTNVIRDRTYMRFLFAVVLCVIVFFQHEGPLPLVLVNDRHFSPAFYGTLFTINTLLIVAMEVPLTSSTSHWSYRRALGIGSLLIAVGFGGYGLGWSAAAVIATTVVWTFGEMLIFPGMAAYIADVTPAGRRGAYSGAYTTANAVALAIGPWLGTWVLAQFGGTALWTSTLICGLAATAIFATTREPARRLISRDDKEGRTEEPIALLPADAAP
jgi:MFS family permease